MNNINHPNGNGISGRSVNDRANSDRANLDLERGAQAPTNTPVLSRASSGVTGSPTGASHVSNLRRSLTAFAPPSIGHIGQLLNDGLRGTPNLLYLGSVSNSNYPFIDLADDRLTLNYARFQRSEHNFLSSSERAALGEVIRAANQIDSSSTAQFSTVRFDFEFSIRRYVNIDGFLFSQLCQRAAHLNGQPLTVDIRNANIVSPDFIYHLSIMQQGMLSRQSGEPMQDVRSEQFSDIGNGRIRFLISDGDEIIFPSLDRARPLQLNHQSATAIANALRECSMNVIDGDAIALQRELNSACLRIVENGWDNSLIVLPTIMNRLAPYNIGFEGLQNLHRVLGQARTGYQPALRSTENRASGLLGVRDGSTLQIRIRQSFDRLADDISRDGVQYTGLTTGFEGSRRDRPLNRVSVRLTMGSELLELSGRLRTRPELHYHIIYRDTESELPDAVQAGADVGGLTVYAWNQVFKQMERHPLFEKSASSGVLSFRSKITMSKESVEQFQDIARLFAKAVRLHEGKAVVDGERLEPYEGGNGQHYLQRFSDAIYRSIAEFNFESSIEASERIDDLSTEDVRDRSAIKSPFDGDGLVACLYKSAVIDPLCLKMGIDFDHFDLYRLSESEEGELTHLAKIVKPELLKDKPDATPTLDWLVGLNVVGGSREALALVLSYATPYFLLAETFHNTFSKLEGRPFTDSSANYRRIEHLFQGETLQHRYRCFKEGSKSNCIVVEQSPSLDQCSLIDDAKRFFDTYLEGCTDEGRALCKFITSSDTIGPKGIKLLIVPDVNGDRRKLPKSHTCFSRLDLQVSSLSNYSAFKERLDQAVIDSGQGFYID